jgi:hypothetical protein
MKRKVIGGVGLAAAAATGAFAAQRVVRARSAHTNTDRWLVVTVNCPPERLNELPEPLRKLGDTVETKVRPAPGGRGSELAARPLQPGASASDVRSALRDAKSLLETGEVLQPDRPSSTKPTATGKLVDMATKRAGGEGRL